MLLIFLLTDTVICICHSLEVEGGEKYRVTFLGERRIVNAGWLKFSTANKLLVGDRLVFHLVRPLKFKVVTVVSGYIVLFLVNFTRNSLVLNTLLST
ncbi:hypothetical protein ACFX13_035390 [Malus domestica]